MHLDEEPLPEVSNVEESEYSAESSVQPSPKPKPRKRVARIAQDEAIEIRRTAMSEQSANYTQDMKKLRNKKNQQKHLLAAKSHGQDMVFGWPKDNKGSGIARRFNGQCVLEILNSDRAGSAKATNKKGKKKRASFADTNALADKRARTNSPAREDNEIGLNTTGAYEPDFMQIDDGQYADQSMVCRDSLWHIDAVLISAEHRSRP